MNFSTSVSEIPYVGPINTQKLQKLHINTVGDLLFYFPRRYENFSHKASIASIYNKGKYVVEGKVVDTSVDASFYRKKSLFTAKIIDSTGEINAVWFNQPYLKNTLQRGDVIILSGIVNYSKQGLQFINPFFVKKNDNTVCAKKILSLYPEKAGISSRFLGKIIKEALTEIKLTKKETLPIEIIEKNSLLSLKEALWQIHFPSSVKTLKEARYRFSFERIFLLQLFVLQQKLSLAKKKGISIPMDIEKVKELLSLLPFTLTGAQKKATWQILKDIEKDRPMNRLLEGDVGSGKTIVGAIAALTTIRAGYQVALMAPTEILSKQHFDELAKLLWRFNIDIGLLTGKKDKWRSKRLKGDTVEISRQKLIEKTKKGEIGLIVGTHALIQEKVRFKNLALIILDEQHRFGVEQRAKLSLKDPSYIPHFLSMTATPIPRTLALTIYGDLDLSVIDEMPTERKPITTRLISPQKRKETYLKITEEIKKGRQVFFICPRIEDPQKEGKGSIKDKNSPWKNLKSVEVETKHLSSEVFPNFNVASLHGKMKSTEKEQIIKKFQQRKIDILVSTSVIEVGIDIRNAGIIIIEGAEMFGLAQLHQFRGRVGRGDKQSYCFLFTSSWSEKIKKRLQALLTSKNGFELAERDLKIRGPGDFLGKKQWGIADFTMDALQNHTLVEKTRETAQEILTQDPQLKKYPLLYKRVLLLKNKLHLE